MYQIEHRSRTGARVVDVRLGTASSCDLFGTLPGTPNETRRGVKECVHIRAPAKV